ncbi:unnamed protein product [Cylicocyclus nassatus]|uniref:Uncharacterized protein n=1 Tax=Cylicocyclus nassatus TaxID=53992 RepID=A0AA36MCK9_CYLNA|nr:unnamed protein product [Cylicocyclus nassatus]
MAIVCATMKLCLTHNTSSNLANCDLTCFMVMILVFVTIFVHKFNDDREGRIAGGKTSMLSVTITGSIALLITAVFGVVDYETDFDLFNYINLSIIYSIQNCLICVLISLYCPIACSSFAGFPQFHHGLKASTSCVREYLLMFLCKNSRNRK